MLRSQNPSRDNFLNEISFRKNQIDRELEEFLEKSVRFLPPENQAARINYEFTKGFCLSEGKRLRPILTLAAYKAFSGQANEKEVIPAAISIELFHNYTLIHDDIYDEDDMRRGIKSPHFLFRERFQKEHPAASGGSRLYKNPATRFSVISGFISGKILYSLSLLALLSSPVDLAKKEECLRWHQQLSLEDNIGQATDLFFEMNPDISEEEYFALVLRKTGHLFMSAFEWGAFLGGASASQIKPLKNFLKETAYVFQIKDDLLDIDSDGKKGRLVGSDIKKGKKTLMLIHALKNASPEEKKALLKIVGNAEAGKEDVQKAIRILEKTGSLDYCQKTAEEKIKKALDYLHDDGLKLKREDRIFFESFARHMWQRKK
jgi:geranylgeranyl diphosphate synthase type I